MSTGQANENTSTSAADTSTTDVPPSGFDLEAMKAMYEMTLKLQAENELLARQVTDMRTLIQKGQEATNAEKAYREADRVANEAATNLLKAQLAQAQSNQGSYSSNRGYGPWTTDATSMHVPPYQHQQYQQWQNPSGGNYGPAGGSYAGAMQQA